VYPEKVLDYVVKFMRFLLVFFFFVFLTEFISRHGVDGKFSFADQRVVGLLGYAPAELLGKSLFELVHHEEQSHIKDSFEQGAWHRVSASRRRFSFSPRAFFHPRAP
jgi:PAS domain-containing protein